MLKNGINFTFTAFYQLLSLHSCSAQKPLVVEKLRSTPDCKLTFMRPVTVYLDSSDFSMLTKSAGMSNEQKMAAKKLKELVSTGLVTCHFSGTHLSEMAPLNTQSVSAAQNRAEVLQELCGRNALLSQDQLFISEIHRLYSKEKNRLNIFMPNGNWLPSKPEDIFPAQELENLNLIASAINDGTNRKDRRATKRKIVKNGKIRPGARSKIFDKLNNTATEVIFEGYPIRRKTLNILMKCAINEATKEEAFDAFIDDLLDPVWMMTWFEKNSELMSPFIEWTRKPAFLISRFLSRAAFKFRSKNIQDTSSGTDMENKTTSLQDWTKQQNQVVLTFVRHLCESELSKTNSEITLEDISEYCPALSVAVRSIHSAFRTATTQERPRPPRPSDYTDAMHAAYAPYVDVFRADRFMAPHVEANTKKYGTCVVSKFSDLPIAIEKALENTVTRNGNQH